jgi:hypothetical protein
MEASRQPSSEKRETKMKTFGLFVVGGEACEKKTKEGFTT